MVILHLTLGNILTSQSIGVDSRVTTEALFFAQYSSELGLTDADEMQPLRSFVDNYGWTRSKYQQYHNDHLVKGAVYTLHSKSGLLKKGTGVIVPHLAATTQVNVTDDQIKSIANDRYTEAVRLTPSDTVIMSRAYPDQGGGYRTALAIEVNNDNLQVPIREILYIDAQTAHLIYVENKILHQSTPANAQTKYYGEQSIITQQTAQGKYILRDTTRGAGIVTINGQERDNDYDYGYGEFENDSTEWEWDGNWQTEVSTDAHYCASRYYDWMDEMFGWEGVDGIGGELICINNIAGKFFVNAYWNGIATHYGNGDCANYDPLTTLDVVGHEFAHGFTEFSSGLIYRNQSGALNEAISDIIGKSLEFAFDFDNFDWFIGNRFRINENAGIFRSMSDPNERNDPKFYDGDFWFYSAGDNGGVHSNSGLLNYWFYTLVEGQTGINEVDYSFNIPELGFEKTLDVVYGMQIGYLTENSTYIEAMYSSLEVAKDYWGETSAEYLAIVEAWLAVGLYPTIDDYDLSLEVTEDVIYLCPGEEQTTTLIVRNVGRLNYDKSNVEIILTSGGILNTLDVLLPLEFAPGDSLLLDIPLDFPMESGVGINIDLEYGHIEGNNLNNREGISAIMYDRSGSDLLLREVLWRLDDECDIESVEGLRVNILNNGCEVIPQNESIGINLETPFETVQIEINVPFDLAPGRSRISTIFVNEDQIDLLEVNAVSLTYENDIDDTNDRILTPDIISPSTITDGYLDDLEESAIPQFYITGSTFATTDSVLTYQNNTVLAIAGRSGASSFINCPDLQDFYDSNYQKKNIQFCTNTIGMEEPEFRFEMLSKTRLVEQNQDVPYHHMVSIDIPGMEPYLIRTSSDDVWETHKISLPVGFNDILTVTAFALSGSASFTLPDLEDSDYMLFDNFRLLEEAISDVEDISHDREIHIYPNPTQDWIQISGQAKNSRLIITDFTGRTLINQLIDPVSTNIDLASLSAGIYLSSIFEDGRLIDSQKIIKTE